MMNSKTKYPIIVEFAGMPGAGKTRTIDILDHYYRRRGYQVRVIAEGAQSCPFNQESRVQFASWTANRVINLLLEEALSQRSHDLVLVDRGIFDAQAFMRLLLAEGFIDDEYARTFIGYVGSEYWNKYISLVILLDVSDNESWGRYRMSHLTKAPGPIMNRKTLKLLYKCYDEVDQFYSTTLRNVPVSRISAVEHDYRVLAKKCTRHIERIITGSKTVARD